MMLNSSHKSTNRPTTDEFRDWIDGQSSSLGSGWVATLEDRKREEAEFHDADRKDHRDESEDSTSNRRFYASQAPLRKYMARWMETHTPGKVFLDYACGHGKNAIRAANHGATLSVGIDISEVSVSNAKELAAAAGVSDRTRYLQRDCEATGFPDNSFDVVMCSGMLHHLDLARGFPEIHRILAPGGRILCVEALAYNPAIKLYRKMTPHLRTEWESQHILSMKQVEQAKQWFELDSMRFFNLTSPLATFVPDGPARRVALRLTHAIDAILTRLPFVQLLSWVFVFELVKSDKTHHSGS